MKLLLAAWVVAVFVLHQDNWNWTNKTLVLGVLPIGLAYHALYSCLAAVTMWLLVQKAWPHHLESVDPTEARNAGVAE